MAEAVHIAPVVTTTSTLSSNIIQNGDNLVLANPGPPGKIAVKTENVFALGSRERGWGSSTKHLLLVQ